MQHNGPSANLYPRKTRVQRGVLLSAFLLPLLIYLRTLGFDFVYDDVILVLNNPAVQSPVSWVQSFQKGMWTFAGGGMLPYYRPLLVLLLGSEHRLFGNDPLFWHFVNLMLHLATVGLVYWAGKLFLRQRNAALIGALLFGVFPLGTEVVSWVAAVNESLLAIFLLLSFGAFLKARSSSKALWWSAFSWLMFLMAMLVKELAIVFPALVLYCALRMHEGSLREKGLGALRVTGAYAAVVFGVLMVRARVIGQALVNGSIGARFATLGAVVQFAFAKLLWPARLSVFYGAVHPSLARSVIALVLLGVAFLITWRSLQASFLFLWTVFFVVPAINIANPNFVLQTRYLYLAGVAFCWGLGCLFVRFAACSSMTARAAVVGLTTMYAFSSFAASGHWANNLTLFERAVQVAPRSANALFSYSSALQEHNRTEEALVMVTRAHELDPQSWLYLYQISRYQLNLHHLQEAEAAIEAAAGGSIPKSPSQEDATVKMKARILLTEGRVKDAERVIRAGLANEPIDEELRFDLASCLARQFETDRRQ